jgi:hypothetical protein
MLQTAPLDHLNNSNNSNQRIITPSDYGAFLNSAEAKGPSESLEIDPTSNSQERYDEKMAA